jgi:hypothetical protein
LTIPHSKIVTETRNSTTQSSSYNDSKSFERKSSTGTTQNKDQTGGKLTTNSSS